MPALSPRDFGDKALHSKVLLSICEQSSNKLNSPGRRLQSCGSLADQAEMAMVPSPCWTSHLVHVAAEC